MIAKQRSLFLWITVFVAMACPAVAKLNLSDDEREKTMNFCLDHGGSRARCKCEISLIEQSLTPGELAAMRLAVRTGRPINPQTSLKLEGITERCEQFDAD